MSRRPISPRRRSQQGGYMLLMVMVLASCVALFLYKQVPSLAFEAQRDKEDLLIQRGEEYKRAIELQARKFRRYPQSMDELEKFNNFRFLRKRYRDPISGKDEWRLVHIANGIYTDSLVHKPVDPNKKDSKDGKTASAASTNPSMVTNFSIGGVDNQNPGTTTPTYLSRRRPSDANPTLPGGSATTPATVDPNVQAVPAVPGAPGGPNPATLPPGFIPGVQNQPGVAGQMGPMGPAFPVGGGTPVSPTGTSAPSAAGGLPVGTGLGGGLPTGTGLGGSVPQPGTANNTAPGTRPNIPGQTPLSGNVPGTNMNGMPGGQISNTNNNLGATGNSTANTNNSGTNAALNTINSQLRGAAANSAAGMAAGGAIMGNGVAGVASKTEMEGIKVYNERTKYNEWEFLYDPMKDAKNQAAGMAAQQQQGQNGSSGQRSPNGNTPGQSSGNTPGLGSPTGIGGMGQSTTKP